MKQRCIAAVSQIIGRPVTVAESRNIESRILSAMRREAARDPQAWQQLTQAQQLMAGARVGAQEIVHEANLKRVRLALQIQAYDRVEAYLAAQVGGGYDKTRLDAVDRLLAARSDGKNNVLSVESNKQGVAAVAMSRLVDTWEAIHPRFMGLFQNRQMEEALIRQVHGTDTGIPEIRQAAQAWLDTAEALRVRYVAAGGNVGTLANWGMPHAWSQKLVNAAGRDRWVNDALQHVDRSRYVHEDGRLFSDPEMEDFLREAWLTIATDGANKTPGTPVPGGAIKANRGSEHRSLHFADGDAALAMFQAYSERNLFSVLSGHVEKMAGDIALIEQFGPNSDLAMEALLAREYKAAAVADPASEKAAKDQVTDIATLYNYLAGNVKPPRDNWLAKGMADLRAILSAAKLGSAAITSIGDEGTMYLTSHVNQMPGFKVFLGELRGLNLADRTERALAMRAGLMVKTMHEDVNRFAADAVGGRWSSKMSSFFMKLSGLNAITEVRKRAFSATMMDTIGSLTRQHADINALDPQDYRFLVSKGITPEEWAIWRQATPEDWGHASQVLTADSIMQVQGVPRPELEAAASKLMSVVLEEQNNAVIEPGARQRARLAGTEAGTVGGELMRSIFLFKSFPHAMIEKHVGRGVQAYDGWTGKVGYLASLVALTTISGAVAIEVNDILSGRDPRNLNPFNGDHAGRNWISAFLKGGALGVYGDFLFDEAAAGGRSPVETWAGPVAGTLAVAMKATQGNAVKFMRGDDTNVGADTVRFLRGITPGSNLWYTKAVTDHLIFQEMQNYFSPGYLNSIRAKAYRDAGTTYWWNPGAPADNIRAPNLQSMIGESP